MNIPLQIEFDLQPYPYPTPRLPSTKSIRPETIVGGWMLALKLSDPETLDHTLRGTRLALALGQEMNIGSAQLTQLEWGALLHDIGKLAIPKQILHKPGKLNEQEWNVIRQHPISAYEMLAPHRCLHQAVEVPYCHHEKWDGSGYPRGLSGEEIPLLARIFAVADVWDALTSKRSYREAWSFEDARSFIQSQTGVHFDPNIARAFLRMQGASCSIYRM